MEITKLNWIDPNITIPERGKVYLVCLNSTYEPYNLMLTFMKAVHRKKEKWDETQECWIDDPKGDTKYYFVSLHSGHKANGVDLIKMRDTKAPREEMPLKYIKAYLDPREISLPEWSTHICECPCKKKED